MENSGKKVELKVGCVGDLSLEPSSVQELLSISNIGDYKIETLKLETWGDPVITVNFTLGTESPIKLYVSGDDPEVIKTYDKLWREVSQTCKSKWTFIHESLSAPGGSGPIGFILSFIVLVFILAHYNLILRFSFLTYMGLVFLICLPITIITSFLIWKSFTTIYPKGIFLIGVGVQEYEAIKSRRQIVSPLAIAVAIIVALIVAIGVHWLGW